MTTSGIKSSKREYGSIPNVVGDQDGSSSPEHSRTKRRRSVWFARASVIGVVIVVAAVAAYFKISSNKKAMTPLTHVTYSPESATPPEVVPYGVNLGSWLSLEDYFFVGNNGAVEVATDFGKTAAECFPPHFPHMSWQSETDLLGKLIEEYSVTEAIMAFTDYRDSFVDLENDLSDIKSRGIQAVRVPASWCWTHTDPRVEDLSNWTDPELLEEFTCLDPYFALEDDEVRWPAVPTPLMESLLQASQKQGLKVVLDVHTGPGGTSLGTFSGVWPKEPLFWKYDGTEHDVSRNLLQKQLTWIESLDDEMLKGLGGFTPMNEPAHLAGNYGPGSGQPNKPSFVPSLSKKQEEEFREKYGLEESMMGSGPHLRVLKWQSDALEAFRKTNLSSRDVDMVINVIESIFVAKISVPPAPEVKEHGEHPFLNPHPYHLLATWWKLVTSVEERSRWAVLDIHHYHAWDTACQGSTNGIAYACGDLDQAKHILSLCTTWASVFRDAMGEDTARLSSGEFSASTYHTVLESCTDPRILRLTYEMQLHTASDANIHMYFWAWKMPFGGDFRNAWSFRELMHRLGDSSLQDDSNNTCGA